MADLSTPARHGNFWVFPNGKILPVVTGGADEPPEPGDKPNPDDKPEPKLNADADDLAAVRAALKKANKEAEESRRKLKEIEDRDKSDGEKLTDRLTAAEKRAEAAEARALRLEVAASKGLTPGQAKRLAGNTQEELEADADELLADFAPAAAGGGDDDEQKPRPISRPQERLRGGGAPAEEPEETDPRKLADLIARR